MAIRKIIKKPKLAKKKLDIVLTKQGRIEIATKICNTYAEGKYTIASVCESYGVSMRAFRLWATAWDGEGTPPKYGIPEIAELYQLSKTRFKERKLSLLREYTLTGLESKVKGYDYEEVHTTLKEGKDGEGNSVLVPSAVKKIKKHVPPSDIALIFVAKNVLEDNFSDKRVLEHQGKINRPIDSMNERELEAFIEEAESKINDKNKKKEITTGES